MRTMSRTAILVVAVLFGAMALAGPAAAQGHALITSAGQSPGALMLQVLARQANVEHVYDATAEVAMLEDATSLMVVIGASMKGLGAAGIDLEDEFARVSALLERAKELGMPIIALHVEGGPRRGATSDELSELVFPYATHAVVRADGDDDGFFTNLAEQHGVPLSMVEATAHVAGVLAEIYN